MGNGPRPQPPAAGTVALPSHAVMNHVPPRPAVALTPGFQYKSSPFYEMKRRLGDVKICESKNPPPPSCNAPLTWNLVVAVMKDHRNTITLTIKSQEVQDCQTDPALRIFVFCAAGNTGIQDICFPHQSELKVNGGEIKANLRGLKNKAGSTRPADITSALRFRPSNYTNSVEFTYALTTKVNGTVVQDDRVT